MMNPASESVRRHPFGQRIGIKKRTKNGAKVTKRVMLARAGRRVFRYHP
jgi:hypothetical protein